jgi:dCTP deaminase
MSVVTQKELRRRLRLWVTDPESLVITPLLDANASLSEDAIDLRLGCYFLVPNLSPAAFYCPDEASHDAHHSRVHVPLGRFLVIPPHQTVLGATLEYIKLPYDVSGQILTKSSVARTFIIIETAPWIHPCYRGCLTLEIANVSNTPILLYPGRLIAQLVLLRALPKPRRRDLLDGSYLGAIFPEAPKFNDPEYDLGKIGVGDDSVWRIPSAVPASQLPRPPAAE